MSEPLKKEYIWICDDHNCQCQVSVKLTESRYFDLVYFSRKLRCPVCAMPASRVKESG